MAEHETVRRAQKGDRGAFAALVAQYRGEVCQLTGAFSRNAEDAEDLAHDAFVEAFLKLHQLKDPERFHSWLKTLALNVCRMWARERLKQSAREFPAGQQSDGDWLSGMRVAEGLTNLSPAHRLILQLYYWEGLSYNDIGQFLQVPPGTVMSRLHRARESLRRSIALTNAEMDIPMTEPGPFQQEVDAEIDILMSTAEKGWEPPGLRLLLEGSPNQFIRLVRSASDAGSQRRLAGVLRWLGRPGMEAVLNCRFSADGELRDRASRVLQEWAGRHQLNWYHDDYVLLDLLIARSVPDSERVAVVIELLDSKPIDELQALLVNAVLCYPDAAFPLLMDRFMAFADVRSLYESSWVLHALCRTGTRFYKELLVLLAGDDTRQLTLAAEALEHSAAWLDPEFLSGAPSEHWRLELRFRKIGGPLASSSLDQETLREAISLTAALSTHPDADIRDRSLQVLGQRKAREFTGTIVACLEHPTASTRVVAARALAFLGDATHAEAVAELTRDKVGDVRRAAAQALGQLGATASEATVAALLKDPDAAVRKAAVTALGELGTDTAVCTLKGLLAGADRKMMKAAAAALYGGRKKGVAWPEATGQRLDKIRGEDARPWWQNSKLVVIRSLEEDCPYEEKDLTRRIARLCHDYSTVRRHLVMEGRNRLMSREKGIYELTELGRTVWRVERFIVETYLKGAEEE